MVRGIRWLFLRREVKGCTPSIPTRVYWPCLRTKIRVTVLEGRPLPLPFLDSGDAVYAISSEIELMDAVKESTRMMRDWLVSVSALDATDALMLLSLVGDTQISQIVDPRMTARFRLPKTILKQCGVELP